MKMKYKNMMRDDSPRVLERDYKYKEFKFDIFEGIVSLMKFNKVTDPLIIHYGSEDIKIVDKDYKYLQFAFKNRNFWLTTMYNDKNELIELYFDIIKDLNFDDISNPKFTDMFLDVVIRKDMSVIIIDREELDSALEEKLITKEEYDNAIETSLWLKDYLEKNKVKLIEFCNKCFNDML